MGYVPECGVYSRRLPWSSSLNPYSSRVAEFRQNGAALLDLTSSNPTACSFDYPHRRLASAFHKIPNFEYQPDPFGEPAAREAVRAYYATRGLDVDRDRILLTASTSEAYAQLFKLLCDPEDEFSFPCPRIRCSNILHRWNQCAPCRTG